MMKKCKKCGLDKPLDAYSSFKKNETLYYRGTCNVCRAKEARDTRGDHHRALAREQYARKAAEDPEGAAQYNRDRNLVRTYGITQQDYLRMVEEQENLCYVCEKHGDKSAPYYKLVVDHNHDTGEVRRLLCSHCNTALGHASDSPQRLRALADYLEEEGYYGE